MRYAILVALFSFLVAGSPEPLQAQSDSKSEAPDGVSDPGAEAPVPPEPASADSPAADGDKATHEQLIAIREAIVKSVNEQDVDGLIEHIHPDVVVVWQNAVISRGHEGVRTYYKEALGGPEAVLESFTVEPKVQELTILHGDDTGIAYGTILCHFKFKGGRQFDLNGPWSATLVKNEGDWTIASFHASAGLFDNPLLLAAQAWLIRGCFISGFAGLILGAIIISVLKKRKK